MAGPGDSFVAGGGVFLPFLLINGFVAGDRAFLTFFSCDCFRTGGGGLISFFVRDGLVAGPSEGFVAGVFLLFFLIDAFGWTWRCTKWGVC